jgi:hypothetical protein
VMLDEWNLVKVDNKKIVFGYPQLDIVKSETDSFELVMVKTAYGPTKKDAQGYAKNIRYNFYQADSLLEFSPYYDIDMADKFRDQGVRLVLKVPKGKVIFLSRNMDKIIYDVNNVREAWDGEMVNRRWIMTPEGLDCIDCEGIEDRRVRIDMYHDVPLPPPAPAPEAPPVNQPHKRR